MRIDSPDFLARRTAKSKDYRFVVGIIYDVDSIYLTSHDDIGNVPGTVLVGVLQEPVIVSQRLQPDEARAEIGTASFAIVDIASQFTNEVRERLNDGTSLRGRECRFYFGFEGQSFGDMMLIGTQKIDGASYLDGRYSVACADIQRSLKKEIFDVVSTTLSSTVTAGDTTINVTDATKFHRVFHGESYTDSPNSTVGYFKLKNTIYRYTGQDAGSFTGCTPVFGTVAETVTVDPAVAADRREKVTEYIYLELPAVKLALAILTGNLYSDGATLPDHWHLGTPDQWITEEDFTGIGTDLWNTATDASPNSGYVVRFEGVAKTDGKAFLEKEIYLLLGLFSPVYADGSLGLKRMARIGGDASHVAVLDNSNSIQVGELRHDMKSVHNIFRVNWSWNGTRFNRANDYFDADSRSRHGDSDLYARAFKGLHGSIHADSAVFQQLDTIRDRYAGIPEELSVTLLDSMNHLEVGDIIRGQWRHVRDFSGPTPGANDPGIDRAFEIQNVSCDFRSGVTVELFGSTARASVQPSPTAPQFSLPDDFYPSEGTPLASAPGITIVGGVITAAASTLTGNASLTNAAAIFYHSDDLTLGSGVTLNIGANVQLRIRGFFQYNGIINGIGRGRPGVADDGRALAYSFTGGSGTPGGIAAEAIPGNPGYVGAARGFDGVRTAAGLGTTFSLTTWPPELTASRHPVAPVLSLRYDDTSGDLLGLPDDLRGTGAAPGGRVGNSSTVPYPTEARGGGGAAGGAGLLIICRGMARGANGSINLSGADSAATTLVTTSNLDRYPGAGGAGGPGTLYVLLDGSALSVPDLAAGYIARTGNVPVQGNPLTTRLDNKISTSGTLVNSQNIAIEPVAGFHDPAVIDEMNLSGAALRIQYVPGGAPHGDEDVRPPPLTGMTTTGVPGAISVAVTAPPPEQWDVIGYYAAITNDRTGATLVNTSRNTTFDHAFATATTRYYWARTRLNGAWSDWYPTSATGGLAGTSLDAGSGSAGESIEVQFSVNGSSSWHSTFTTGDLYMRTRVGSGGAWQGPWRVVGEDGDPGSIGADGNVTSFIFRRSATQPTTPTGNAPSGWSDSPPSTNGNPLWVSRALKTPAGILVGSWSVPTILVVDGEDGDQGLPGIQGPGMFDWVNTVGVETTSSSIERVSVGGAWDAGAHSLQSYSDGCFYTCRAGETNLSKVIGFNDDPAVDSGYTGINRGLLLADDAQAYIVTGGGTGPLPQADLWPVHNPPYLSAIPGVAGPGFDTPHGTGRHLGTPQTTVIFVNTLADVNTGGAAPTNWGPVGRTFVGSEEWALRHTASPKVVVYLASGTSRHDPPKSLPVQTGVPDGYVCIAAQTAPFPGLLTRGGKVTLNGANHVLAMHLRVAIGDDADGLGASNRRCIESGRDSVVTHHVVLAHCESQWSVDEANTFYNAHDETSIYACSIVNPLHDARINHTGDPVDEDHGFAMMLGGGVQCGKIGFFRNFIANATDRSPFIVSENAVIANNVVFNPGRPYIGPGNAIYISGQNATENSYTNVLWNVVMRGPENDSTRVGARASNLPAGSRGYSEGNSLIGWTQASQAAFFTTFPSGYLLSSRISSAYPAEWGETGVLHWTANPLAPTAPEKTRIFDLVEATAGAQPGWRTPEISRVPAAIDAMRDISAGLTVGPLFVDAVEPWAGHPDDGGWPTIAEVVIDPLNPGVHWHAPIPTASNRDAIVAGGTTWGNEPWIPTAFRGNSAQLVGRTNLERWLIRQHWFVMSPITRPGSTGGGSGAVNEAIGIYTVDDVWGGVHDGETIRLYKNGTQVGADFPFEGRLFLDTSLYHQNASLENIHFGASGLRGPAGAPAPLLRLSSSAQTFTFPVGGGASTPASITFTAVRQNIAEAVTWTTTPAVTLTGSGDTRTLTGVNFAGNSSVRVRAEAEGFFDEITVVRLTQGGTGPSGQPAVVGYLTNETHTLSADPDGVVTATDLATANGLFRLYEGIVDRTSAAQFSVVSDTNCIVQINTADNTPVIGQVRGFYRVLSMQADQATARLRASYNGVSIDKDFSITRSRAGRPGDGQNLLPIDDWVVGTTGSQGPGGRWQMNGAAAESAIVLGGAGTAPLGPLGTSEMLWECRPDGAGNADGGWDVNNIEIDRRSTYRSTVWFRVNQISGSFYHGARSGGTGVLTLDGVVNANPYFVGGALGGLGVLPNKWYLSVGIVHGSSYTGGDSLTSGIYDPETGRRVFAGTEFKNSTTTTVQSHRCYHFYDTSAATRQWMPKPRLEELNGGEPTLAAMMGIQGSTQWISRGFCYTSARVFYKIGGANSWEDSDIYSSAGYSSCHVQFKAASTTGHFMVGISDAPGQTMSYTNMSHAWYCANGAAHIYEGASYIMDTGPYTTATQFGIKRDTSGNVTYWRDGVQINRGATSTSAPLSYLDTSFYTPGTSATNVAFGPGPEFELINSNDMAPGSATKLYSTSATGPIDTNSDIPTNASAMVVTLSATCNDVNAYWLVTVTCEAQHIGGSGNLNFIGAGYRGINPDSGVIGETGTVGTYVHAGQPRSTKMVRAIVPATKGNQVDLGLLVGRAFPNNVLRFWNIYVTVELIVR